MAFYAVPMAAASERDPGYDRLPMLPITDAAQLRALGNVTRHRILGVLHDRAASAQQLARQLDIRKGSAGYHLKILESAGLVKLVGTRKVRGVIERYYGRTATGFDTTPAGARSLPMRVVADDIDGTVPAPEELLLVRRVRLGQAALARLRRELQDLLDDLVDRAESGEPIRTLAVALYTPPISAPMDKNH
jgi:DNA-binding transcriptional ArsR family regulator